MLFRKTGRVKGGLFVTGLPWSPCYLLDGARPVLFEAGFHCAGRLYERDIRNVISPRQPEMLFLTHVHWDHCGSSAYLKKIFPGMKIAASQKAGEIMQRPNAVKLMRELSRDVIPLVEAIDGIDSGALMRDPFEPFEIDRVLEDGDIIPFADDITVLVLASPGHTTDLLSYYIPEKKVLVATEASGLLLQNGGIGTEFLVDFDAYMASLKRLSSLDVEILCQGHHFVFTGNEVKTFFSRSIEAAGRFRCEVEELLNAEDGAIDRVVTRMKEKEYDTNRGVKQLEHAYLLNLKARVTHLAERVKRQKAYGVQGDKGPKN